jgi:hypothetical protein
VLKEGQGLSGEEGDAGRRASDGGHDDLNRTYSLDPEKRVSKTDSRQYFNLTFNRRSAHLPSSIPTSNLPDVVSSASPSPPRETAQRPLPGTQATCNLTTTFTSDTSLGLMEPDLLGEDTNLLEGVLPDAVRTSTSESDASQSGTSTLEDTSMATTGANNIGCDAALVGPAPVSTSTPIAVSAGKQRAHDELEVEEMGPPHLTSSPKVAALSRQEGHRRTDSNGSVTGIGVKTDHLTEEGSNGASPEVSAVLEWDYDHDPYYGKLLEKSRHDRMSLSNNSNTSDSCSDNSGDLHASPLKLVTSTISSNNNGEEGGDNDDEFENIDDFPLGMNKQPLKGHRRTDSGISEKDFVDADEATSNKRRSVEFDSRVSVMGGGDDGDDKELVEGQVVGDEAAAALWKDLMDGHKKQERPLSLVSTTSADTGKMFGLFLLGMNVVWERKERKK